MEAAPHPHALSGPPVQSSSPRPLAGWLDHLQAIHPQGIALGLERVAAVWQRLGAPRPAARVITVGGTNGKGSTVAFLEALLAARGLRLGSYTSPHLLRYNERVRIDGHEAADADLVAAFERIEAARGDITLTWFESGTLAALLLFAEAGLDVAVLEVGLGGRLDAVNLIDADVAIVTTVARDHEDFLGNDLDGIAREKAGIFRAGRPAVIGDAGAPAALLERADEIGAQVLLAGRDFRAEAGAHGWCWHGCGRRIELPEPALAAPCQRANAAAAIAAVHVLEADGDWPESAIAHALVSASVPARLQVFGGDPPVVVDVAHNPQAAGVLAAWLAAHPPAGRNLAVFAALGDKDIAGIVSPLREAFASWHLAGLDGASTRGLPASVLAARLPAGLPVRSHAGDVAGALAGALGEARPGDRIIAFGSFFVAAEVLALKAGDPPAA